MAVGAIASFILAQRYQLLFTPRRASHCQITDASRLSVCLMARILILLTGRNELPACATYFSRRQRARSISISMMRDDAALMHLMPTRFIIIAEALAD